MDAETHMHRGRENRMDKSLLSRSALVNLSLWGMVLAPTGTSLCVPSLWVIPVHQPQASCILH